MSASNSVVSGLTMANIVKGDTLTITVYVKDSSGNIISAGGDKLMIKISNSWTKISDNYCFPNGNSSPLSSNMNDIMIDHNNGTYTYSYTTPTTSKYALFRVL